MAEAKKPVVPATNPVKPNVTPSVPTEEGKPMETHDESEGGADGNAETGSKLPTRDAHSGEAHVAGLKQRGKLTAEQDAKVGEEFVAGFNFDLYSLHELYANIRDGNYWSAFRIAIEILHQNVSPVPPMTRGTNRNVTMNRPIQTPVRMADVMDAEENLDDCCKHLESNVKTHSARSHATGVKANELPGASQEKNVGMVDIVGLIALVNMIRNFVKQFREGRGS